MTDAGFLIAAYAVIIGGLAPRLEPLWLSTRTAEALSAADLNPRDGVAPGPGRELRVDRGDDLACAQQFTLRCRLPQTLWVVGASF